MARALAAEASMAVGRSGSSGKGNGKSGSGGHGVGAEVVARALAVVASVAMG